MASSNNPKRLPSQHDSKLQLIEATTDALTRLITTGTSTVVAVGILVILTVIILRADTDAQQQILPLLTGMLGVIIGQMLSQGGTSPPEPPGTSGPSE